jgi:hypothetical protein
MVGFTSKIKSQLLSFRDIVHCAKRNCVARPSLALQVLQTTPKFRKRSKGVINNDESLICTRIKTREDVLGFANDLLKEANTAQTKWDSGRQKGLRRFPALIESFLVKFHDLLDCYSPIVEILKQANPQFGGLAYSTLSIFLLVSNFYA